jgi:hypothetical protein
MMLWRRECRTFVELLAGAAPEPVLLAGLEAADQLMTGSGRVFARMLRWRRVTAADMSTLGAAAKVKPQTSRGETFHAPGSRLSNYDPKVAIDRPRA